MKNKIVTNYIYNLIYQVLVLVLPLVTVPYVSRTLGVEQIGVNAFTLATVQYFVIFGSIGIDLYAKRTTAFIRDDKQKLSVNFWEITILKFCLLSISYILFISMFGFSGEYRVIYLIQSINIIGAAIDITWFYEGLEEFKSIVRRNLLIKILAVISIFVLIKNSNDLSKYMLINGLSLLLGQIVLWSTIKKLLNKVAIKELNILRHLRPSLKYFLPQIAIQIYTLMDRTLLGLVTNTTEVGLYDQAQKIIKMVLAIVTASGTILMPRISNLFAKDDVHNIKRYINKSSVFSLFVAVPLSVGLACVSKELIPWFFGEGFNGVIPIMIIGSGLILAIGFNNVLGIQYLMATGKTKEFTISVTVGSIVNLIINLILIRHLGAIGAMISSVLAEFMIIVVQIIYIKEILDHKYIIGCLKIYFIASIVLVVVTRTIGNILGIGIITNVLQVGIGGICYLTVLVILKDKMINEILRKIIPKRFIKG